MDDVVTQALRYDISMVTLQHGKFEIHTMKWATLIGNAGIPFGFLKFARAALSRLLAFPCEHAAIVSSLLMPHRPPLDCLVLSYLSTVLYCHHTRGDLVQSAARQRSGRGALLGALQL